MSVVPAFMPTAALAGGLCLAGISVLSVSVEEGTGRGCLGVLPATCQQSQPCLL